jgi:hypothetical protein
MSTKRREGGGKGKPPHLLKEKPSQENRRAGGEAMGRHWPSLEGPMWQFNPLPPLDIRAGSALFTRPRDQGIVEVSRRVFVEQKL